MLVLKNGLLSGKYIAIIVSFLCTFNKLLIATEQRQPLVEFFYIPHHSSQSYTFPFCYNERSLFLLKEEYPC